MLAFPLLQQYYYLFSSEIDGAIDPEKNSLQSCCTAAPVQHRRHAYHVRVCTHQPKEQRQLVALCGYARTERVAGWFGLAATTCARCCCCTGAHSVGILFFSLGQTFFFPTREESLAVAKLFGVHAPLSV
jgi:hypothetical protein